MVEENARPVNTVKRGRAFRGALSWAWTVFGPFVGLVLVTLFFGWLTRDSGSFLTVYNWRTIAVQTVILGTAALGMTAIMIAGGIDLSVGSVIALVTVTIALLVNGDDGLPPLARRRLELDAAVHDQAAPGAGDDRRRAGGCSAGWRPAL